MWCEPGRALVAAGASLVVRVELRKDNFLYINDGVYGSLSDLKYAGLRFPDACPEACRRRGLSG